ncbi:LacI family DNA-binding transcriptional regulator [Galbitalea sp. SE-J8]|uniref:LacI family DNA-binding transcriptional regulator n=1 Tax=Galbitalea sp. SE-J8 TaxID=3054952 RepID=UPI00259CB29D|nr:LacI family DNA-binding transcriptional regulator [Galbitalea sp. SE-J8]MDM4762056.1 LacI family DNA-binding transcriptional regulator [Galbitalea sp. SE-J8]
MARPPVNMSDVAARAGVGMATVSRALKGAPGVSEATRERVRAIAQEIGYVVSPEASRLARGETGRIAVVVSHLSRWFFAEMLDAIETTLRAAELDILLYQVPDARSRHAFFEELPARRKVDAVIVVGLPVDPREQRQLESMGVHIVAAGGQTAGFPYVRIDDEEASRLAIDHLIALGHTRIGMIEAINPDTPDWPVRLGRSEGYHAAVREAGIDDDPDLVVRVPWGGEFGAEAMGALLGLRHPPTAVYAHSDEIALGAMRTLRRLGLDVPGDLSIVGIDDHPLAELCDLTTIGQSVAEQGRIAARMTLDLVHGRAVESATIPVALIVRRSTRRL